MLVIDTKIHPERGSLLELRRDDLGNLKDAVDYDLVMVPTAQAVIDMAELFGYQAKMLALPKPTPPGMGKYRYGLMKTFVCAKHSDLSRSSAFKFQTMKSLYEDQALGLAVRTRRLPTGRRRILAAIRRRIPSGLPRH